MSQLWAWQWWSPVIYSLLLYIMNMPRVPIGTRTLSRPLGCQRRWQGGGGVNIEMTRGVRRRRWWCSGAPKGPLTMLWFHLTVLGPHLWPPCHVVTPDRKRKERRRKERHERRGEGEKGSNSDRFGMDRGHVPINLQPPWEYPDKMKSCLDIYILTMWL